MHQTPSAVLFLLIEEEEWKNKWRRKEGRYRHTGRGRHTNNKNKNNGEGCSTDEPEISIWSACRRLYVGCSMKTMKNMPVGPIARKHGGYSSSTINTSATTTKYQVNDKSPTTTSCSAWWTAFNLFPTLSDVFPTAGFLETTVATCTYLPAVDVCQLPMKNVSVVPSNTHDATARSKRQIHRTSISGGNFIKSYQVYFFDCFVLLVLRMMHHTTWQPTTPTTVDITRRVGMAKNVKYRRRQRQWSTARFLLLCELHFYKINDEIRQLALSSID